MAMGPSNLPGCKLQRHYNDACPDDALKIAEGDCGCGQIDEDSDGDGTADCNDECPDDALKIAAGDCGCGVEDLGVVSGGDVEDPPQRSGVCAV